MALADAAVARKCECRSPGGLNVYDTVSYFAIRSAVWSVK